jgi:hypothetical protein
MADITEQPSATSAGASADYQKTIRVKASPGALFDALRFFMNSPEPLVIDVDEAARPPSVRWTVTEFSFLSDWVGTCPVFTITAGRPATSARVHLGMGRR